MKPLLINVSILLLTSCAVLDYQPKLSSGDLNGNRTTLDLQECKKLARASIDASYGSDSQVPVKDRFKRAYDACMSGRGHNVIR